jgi:hypothetical protein
MQKKEKKDATINDCSTMAASQEWPHASILKLNIGKKVGYETQQHS